MERKEGKSINGDKEGWEGVECREQRKGEKGRNNNGESQERKRRERVSEWVKAEERLKGEKNEWEFLK